MENTTNMVPVIKQEGTVLTDRSVDVIGTSMVEYAEAQKRIGELEGEVRELNNMLDRSEKVINVVVENKGNKVWNDWKGWIEDPSTIHHITFPEQDVNKLADAAVKAQALKDVEEANKKVETAELNLENQKEKVKAIEKRRVDEVARVQEDVKGKIELAVKKAERDNLSEIDRLSLQIQTLNHENDLMYDEKNNLLAERALIIEANEERVKLLEDRIKLLSTPKNDLLSKIKETFNSWAFNRRFKRLGK